MEEESLWPVNQEQTQTPQPFRLAEIMRFSSTISHLRTAVFVGLLISSCSEDDGDITGGEGSFGPNVTGEVSGPDGPLEGALVAGLAWTDNRCGGPGGVFDTDSVKTMVDGTFELELKSGGGGLPGTSVGFLCIVIAAEPPIGVALAPDTMEIMNYEVFLFVPQEIEANFELQPLDNP